MFKYILKKLSYGILVILGVVVGVFYIFHALPGDPMATFIGPRTHPSTVTAIKSSWGLDKPLHIQLVMYINDLSPVAIHEDTEAEQKKYEYLKIVSWGEDALVVKKPYLRRSFQSNRRVGEILIENLEGTMILALSSITIAAILGIIFGMLASLNQNSFLDHALVSLSVLGISMPSFVAAIMISVIFGFYFSHITGLEMTGYIWVDTIDGKKMMLQNLILPSITLGMRPLAIITQLTRSSMLEVLAQDYIRTAKAKGLSYYVIIFKHALKNALNPVITAISGWLASLVTGGFFVEYIFSWKGLGWVTIHAVNNMDFPIVIGSTLVVAALFVFINIAVDILYALIDPRVRLD